MLSGTYDDVTVMLQGNHMMVDELATQLAIMKRYITYYSKNVLNIMQHSNLWEHKILQ